MMTSKIISGGQTGADRAALDFAIAHGIAHGGWCPRGRLAEDGQIDQDEVNAHSITGAVCIYLLLGLLFLFLYSAVALIGSGPFFAQGTDGTRALRLYFSYVALATLGYGDYTPAGDLGHTTAVLEALERLHSERTTFLITHDLSQAVNASIILYVESGRIVERGTHGELMQADGRYASMYRLQTSGRAEASHSEVLSAQP